MFFAEYNDGVSAKAYQVQITFEEDYLRIEGFGFNHRWAYSELIKIEHTKTNFTLFKGDAFPYQQLRFDDASVFNHFQEVAKDCQVLEEYHIKISKGGSKSYVGAILGIFLVLGLIHFFVIPSVVAVVAENFPKDMEAKLGDNYLEIAKRYGYVDSVKTAQLTKITSKVDFQTDYQLDFVVVESDMVNAFALPGGKIIVFTALIDSMTNYHQLISLLGHETGHVELRHSLQSIFSEQSYTILVSSLSGGNSKILESYLDVATTLNSLHGSRSHEQEADDFALKVLLSNNCDPKGVVQLFEILAKGGDNYVPDILSTHPSPEHRISELNSQISKLSAYEVKENTELDSLFKSLQSINSK